MLNDWTACWGAEREDAMTQQDGVDAPGPVALGGPAPTDLSAHIEARFAKMSRLLDGEDVSSMTAGGLSASLLGVGPVQRRVAEEAFALLAHRAGVGVGGCDAAEEAAARVREAIERPLREALEAAQRAARAQVASGPTFRERLVIEAAEALARAVAGGDAAAVGAAQGRLVDRVRLMHAED
jgi:hypothetical protein